ncbi:MAG TPA: DUF1016 N-terminal domain-containing protein [Solirubrobacterales bacterium]|nr:DUF1016 N-terminal domain-containing protein [Solirubrobacterales bacterium]
MPCGLFAASCASPSGRTPPRGKSGAGAIERPAKGEPAGSAAYAEFLADIRRRIATSRTRAAVAVNRELIELYWGIGREILRRQEERGWGAKVIDQLARDLKGEGRRGFSARNLKYMRAFAAAWPSVAIVQTPSAHRPHKSPGPTTSSCLTSSTILRFGSGSSAELLA